MATENNPPLSTDQGAAPAPDVSPDNNYSPESNFNDVLNLLNKNADKVHDTAKRISPTEAIFGELLLFIEKIIAKFWLAILKSLTDYQDIYMYVITQLHEQELKVGLPYAKDMATFALDLVVEAIGGGDPKTYQIKDLDQLPIAQQLWDSIIKPFTLTDNTADPRTVGSGEANAAFLLKRALSLSLAEFMVDSLSNTTGFGWIKNILPLLGFVDRSINPSNIVRQAMEQPYSFLMKAPLQRDMNRKYPIKDLGVGALAKLFLRGAIDSNTYLDRCLNAGLNNDYAQQLILETAKQLSPSEIGTLLQHAYITKDDALSQLKAQGYPEWDANAILFLESHSEYFSMQREIGGKAITAWVNTLKHKKGYNLDTGTLENILQQLGYTDDEIKLAELQAEWDSFTTPPKSPTYSQVQKLYSENIVDLSYVIDFLTNEGFSTDDVKNLVLLDFVTLEQRAATEALLVARLRVQEEQQKVEAATAAAKNEQDLATARTNLAHELDAYQKEIGTLTSLPGIMQLLGIGL